MKVNKESSTLDFDGNEQMQDYVLKQAEKLSNKFFETIKTMSESETEPVTIVSIATSLSMLVGYLEAAYASQGGCGLHTILTQMLASKDLHPNFN